MFGNAGQGQGRQPHELGCAAPLPGAPRNVVAETQQVPLIQQVAAVAKSHKLQPVTLGYSTVLPVALEAPVEP